MFHNVKEQFSDLYNLVADTHKHTHMHTHTILSSSQISSPSSPHHPELFFCSYMSWLEGIAQVSLNVTGWDLTEK